MFPTLSTASFSNFLPSFLLGDSKPRKTKYRILRPIFEALESIKSHNLISQLPSLSWKKKRQLKQTVDKYEKYAKRLNNSISVLQTKTLTFNGDSDGLQQLREEGVKLEENIKMLEKEVQAFRVALWRAVSFGCLSGTIKCPKYSEEGFLLWQWEDSIRRQAEPQMSNSL